MNHRKIIIAIAAALVVLGTGCDPDDVQRAQRIAASVTNRSVQQAPPSTSEPPETFPPATCTPDTGTCQHQPTEPIPPAPAHTEGTLAPTSPCVPDTGTCACVPDTGTCGTLPPPPDNEPQSVP